MAVRPEEVRSAELLAPAGDFETALAAFEAGADAVYCGLADFSARAFAKNFSADDLKRLVRYAHACQVGGGRWKVEQRNVSNSTVQPPTSNLQPRKKVYVTFNTLLDEDQLEGAIETLATLAEIGPDAIIVQDLGVARICRKYFPELTLHASTQLVAHNLEGVLALGELGFTRVVLARELSLDEIASIAKRCGEVELECFIHGALCYSISGLCLFGAMEKGRSGNRGKCPYCCRLPYENAEGKKTLAFSMKDLRAGEDARKLVDAGVVSLKIEGRMKSALYVASVVKWYRQILERGIGNREQGIGKDVTVSDLETVFSRRTTELYLNGGRGATRPTDGVIDPDSLGHLGAPIGTVKRVTKDREGRRWLRFHTARALEKHDGLQFVNPDGGKPLGFGIGEMRPAISRTPVFEVSAGTDVEIAMPEEDLAIRPGDTVYCSMSNAVKRMFPTPSFRGSDYPGTIPLDVVLTIEKNRVTAFEDSVGNSPTAFVEGDFEPAKNPEKTREAAEKAFSKLGGTNYRLGVLTLNDPGKLFVPTSVLNDLRRQFVEKMDERLAEIKKERICEALDGEDDHEFHELTRIGKTVKIRAGQDIPPGEWNEVVVAISADTTIDQLTTDNQQLTTRLALPVYTAEPDFNALRNAVKRFVRAGYVKWEASDLATLRMLKQVGVTDITADWTLYAFNSRALAALAELGVKRFVASPENGRDNLQFFAESGYDVECLAQQSTPLFISLTKPMDQTALAVYGRDGLWITTKFVPRTFDVPEGASTRVDLSWDLI